MVEGRIEILLEVEPGSDPISGQLRDGAGELRGFRGWLQLMAAIEAASAGVEPRSAEKRGSTDRSRGDG